MSSTATYTFIFDDDGDDDDVFCVGFILITALFCIVSVLRFVQVFFLLTRDIVFKILIFIILYGLSLKIHK